MLLLGAARVVWSVAKLATVTALVVSFGAGDCVSVEAGTFLCAACRHSAVVFDVMIHGVTELESMQHQGYLTICQMELWVNTQQLVTYSAD